MSAEVLLNGIFSGAIYALVALGLTIIYQPTRIMNFGQGEAVILGAAISYQVTTLFGWGWPAAIFITLVGAILAGLIMERMIMLPIKLSGSKHAWIIATLAVALIFQSAFSLIFNDVDGLRPDPLVPGNTDILGVSFGNQQLLAIVFAVLIVVAYGQFLDRNAFGRAIRATAHNEDTAVLMGIPVQRIVKLSFIMGVVVTAIAGLLAAPVLFIAPAAGLLFTIKGFIAAVIGGVGSARGALVGGMAVGLLDNVVRAFIGGSAGNFAVFATLALILVLFPAGLFGKPMEAH